MLYSPPCSFLPDPLPVPLPAHSLASSLLPLEQIRYVFFFFFSFHFIFLSHLELVQDNGGPNCRPLSSHACRPPDRSLCSHRSRDRIPVAHVTSQHRVNWCPIHNRRRFTLATVTTATTPPVHVAITCWHLDNHPCCPPVSIVPVCISYKCNKIK